MRSPSPAEQVAATRVADQPAMDVDERARRFHALHAPGELLLLPNPWDAMSAAIFAAAGFPALATTSSGVANALGYADGERAPRDEVVSAVHRIAAAVDVPLSADIEAGFGGSPAEVGETVRRIVAAGAVGINLEDVIYPEPRLYAVAEAAARVGAARAAAEAEGVALFLNARSDVYLLEVGAPATRLDETLRRARAYVEAGADGIFVPGVADAPTIARLVAGIPAPLSLLSRAGIPGRAELRALGVRRLSIGPRAVSATMGYLRTLAAQLIDADVFVPDMRGAMSYDELNALFTPISPDSKPCVDELQSDR